MIRHPSAEKRARQSEKRRLRNKAIRTRVRGAVAAARSALESGAADAAARVQQAEALLRRAVTKGVLHTRTASRTVSRLRHAEHRRR
jgi:small subunit ribosomal protein S20